jgi:hypothetical protein
VEKAKAIGDVVLIAWQHERIPNIAALILGDVQHVPPRWPGHRFDLVWVFDRQAGGRLVLHPGPATRDARRLASPDRTG